MVEKKEKRSTGPPDQFSKINLPEPKFFSLALHSPSALIVGGVYSEPLTEEDIYKRILYVVRKKLANSKHKSLQETIALAQVTARKYVGS